MTRNSVGEFLVLARNVDGIMDGCWGRGKSRLGGYISSSSLELFWVDGTRRFSRLRAYCACEFLMKGGDDV